MKNVIENIGSDKKKIIGIVAIALIIIIILFRSCGNGETENKVQKMKDSLNSAKLEVILARERLEIMDFQNEREKYDYLNKLDYLENEFDSLIDDCKTLDCLENHKHIFNDLYKDVEKIKKERETFKAEAKRYRAENAELRKKVAFLEGENKRLESIIGGMNKKIASLESKLKSHNGEKSDLLKQIEDLKKERELLNSKLLYYEQEKEKLQEELNKRNEEFDKLKNSMPVFHIKCYYIENPKSGRKSVKVPLAESGVQAGKKYKKRFARKERDIHFDITCNAEKLEEMKGKKVYFLVATQPSSLYKNQADVEQQEFTIESSNSVEMVIEYQKLEKTFTYFYSVVDEEGNYLLATKYESFMIE